MQENSINYNTHMPDEKSYDYIWDTIIDPEICNYEASFPGQIQRIPFVKNAIWNKYVELNNLCKTRYMEHSEDRIDRHKVAACYMLSIANVAPMRFDIPPLETDKHLIANELLAITVGFSILRAFVVSAIEESNSSDETKKELKAKFDSGIKTPKGQYINHGDYVVNYANELYYSIKDGKDCILSIAHELFLLELFTLYVDNGVVDEE